MTEYTQTDHTHDEQTPVYKQSNMPWIFMFIMLPLFFLFGWVANEAFNVNSTGLILGIGGGAENNQERVISPTPDSMMSEEPTVTPTQMLTVTPTNEPPEEVNPTE